MIQKLVLKNFESHIDTTIDFNSGVYVLTGSSNAGKSSILRALRLIILNEPSSDKYINFNADECSVTLYINNHVIERVRAKNNKKNLYIIDGKEIKAFGQGVPQEVSDIIGMNSINFEWQWDKRPFLLSETGGYISQKINEIMNLSLIDSSQKAIDSMKRSVKKEIESENYRKDNLEKNLKNFEYLDDIAPVIEEIGRDYNYLNYVTSQKELIQDTVSSIEACSNSLKNIISVDLEDVSTVERELSRINKIENDLVKINDNITSNNFAQQMLNYLKIVDVKPLESEIKTLKNQEDEREGYRIFNKKYEDTVSDINKINTVPSADILTIYDGVNDIMDKEKKIDLATNIIDQYNTFNSNITSLDNEIRKLKEEYKRIAPDLCPICGHKMNKELE